MRLDDGCRSTSPKRKPSCRSCSTALWAVRKSSSPAPASRWRGSPRLKRRRAAGRGAWRGWAADVPTEVFLAPMDPEDLDAAEGKFTDEFGISLPRPDSREAADRYPHAVLWWLTDDPRLSRPADAACRSARTSCSSARASDTRSLTSSVIGTASAVRRQPAAPGFSATDFEVLPMSLDHALGRGRICPGPHRDPWDRIMIAQAHAEQLQRGHRRPGLFGLRPAGHLVTAGHLRPPPPAARSAASSAP